MCYPVTDEQVAGRDAHLVEVHGPRRRALDPHLALFVAERQARCGALDEGRLLEENALERMTAQGNRRFEGACRVYLAIILLLAGDHERAEREAREEAEAVRDVQRSHARVA